MPIVSAIFDATMATATKIAWVHMNVVPRSAMNTNGETEN